MTGIAPAARSAAPRTRSGVLQGAALVGFVALAQLAGLIGVPFTDRASGGWYDSLDLPPFNPPSWVFGPVWTVLYVLIGVAAWLVWRERPSVTRRAALTWWGVQLVLNAIWSPLFFGAQAPWPAFIEILVLLGAIMVTASLFRVVRPAATMLMVPYALWVAFATVLNGTIAATN